MFILLSIYSKNQTSLTNFLKFFYKLNSNKIINVHLFTVQHSVANKTFRFSVLKSPHVNKSAQEQFEYKLFTKRLKIKTFQMTKLVTMLKLVQAKLFSDVDINFKILFSQNSFEKTLLEKINPNLFIFSLSKTSCVSKKLLKTFDIYGEIQMQRNKKI